MTCSERAARLTFAQALVLGALHGPTELLPISSSGHTATIPWLLHWSYSELEPTLRKAFEVALHSGAGAGLLIARPRTLTGELKHIRPRQTAVIGLGSVPAGLTGLLLERPIERKLGTPQTIAAGLLAGALAMALADRCPQERRAEEAGCRDGLLLGLAQGSALIPGVSRSAAVLTAARRLRFTRDGATVLSRQLAFPVIGGATLLKAWRLTRGQIPREARAPLAVATLASFASTILMARALRGREGRPLLPYAGYRAILALVIFVRIRREPRARTPP